MIVQGPRRLYILTRGMMVVPMSAYRCGCVGVWVCMMCVCVCVCTDWCVWC